MDTTFATFALVIYTVFAGEVQSDVADYNLTYEDCVIAAAAVEPDENVMRVACEREG